MALAPSRSRTPNPSGAGGAGKRRTEPQQLKALEEARPATGKRPRRSAGERPILPHALRSHYTAPSALELQRGNQNMRRHDAQDALGKEAIGPD